MSKKSFKEISSQAAKAFITMEPPAAAAQPVMASPAIENTASPEALSAVPPPAAEAPQERRPGRPRVNKRTITKSSQENLPENWTRATFIVREDLLDAFKDRAADEGVTLKAAVNAALEQYLSGGI